MGSSDIFRIKMSNVYHITGKFFVLNPSKYLQGKCGTKQFRRFENEFRRFENEFRRFEIEFWGFENEFPHFQMQFFTKILSCVTTILFKAAFKSGTNSQNPFSGVQNPNTGKGFWRFVPDILKLLRVQDTEVL